MDCILNIYPLKNQDQHMKVIKTTKIKLEMNNQQDMHQDKYMEDNNRDQRSEVRQTLAISSNMEDPHVMHRSRPSGQDKCKSHIKVYPLSSRTVQITSKSYGMNKSVNEKNEPGRSSNILSIGTRTIAQSATIRSIGLANATHHVRQLNLLEGGRRHIFSKGLYQDIMT